MYVITPNFLGGFWGQNLGHCVFKASTLLTELLYHFPAFFWASLALFQLLLHYNLCEREGPLHVPPGHV